MKIVCVTGGIGSGKSTITKALSESLSIPVIDADVITTELLQDPTNILLIRQKLAVENSGNLRVALQRVAFEDPHKRAQLEHILHPQIFQKITTKLIWYFLCNYPVVLVEIPLLRQWLNKQSLWVNWLASRFLTVILVEASESCRLQRIAQRNPGLSQRDITARILAQTQDFQHERLFEVYKVCNEGSLGDLARKNLKSIEGGVKSNLRLHKLALCLLLFGVILFVLAKSAKIHLKL